MEKRTNVLTSIIVILTGVLFQLKALGILGSVGDGLLDKLWPLLLAAAAIDLFTGYRRLLGAIVLGLTSIALLCTQFLDTGWTSDIWRFFITFWPLLMIIYGFDILFSERSLFTIIVIVVVVLIAVYALLNALDVPIMKKLPQINLQGMALQQFGSGNMIPNAPASPAAPAFGKDTGSIQYDLPEQQYVTLDLSAASGKVQLKAGSDPNRLISGRVSLSGSETLTQNTEAYAQQAYYTLQSSGTAPAADSSEWNLGLTGQRPLSINCTLQRGYLKADLRDLNLNQVRLENYYGPVDVMLPLYSSAPLEIIADAGDIRVFIPSGGSAEVSVSGTDQISIPEGYYTEDGTISPYTWQQQPVKVTVRSNGASVQIRQ